MILRDWNPFGLLAQLKQSFIHGKFCSWQNVKSKKRKRKTKEKKYKGKP